MRTKLLTVLLLCSAVAATILATTISQQLHKRSFYNLSDEELKRDDIEISKILAERLRVTSDEIEVELTSDSGIYAVGNLTKKGTEKGGAYWLAAKKKGTWKIIKYGNGELKCSIFKEYPKFPIEMISECQDPFGKIIPRK